MAAVTIAVQPSSRTPSISTFALRGSEVSLHLCRAFGDSFVAIDDLLVLIQHQLLERVDVVGEFGDCHASVIRDLMNDIR